MHTKDRWDGACPNALCRRRKSRLSFVFMLMAVQNGWVKLHRKIVDWEWYQDDKVFRVFLHLLLTANHEEKKWQGKTIGRGQKITSYAHLAHDTGLSVRSIRTAISKLQMTGEVTYQNELKYSLITINNWDSYQVTDKQNDTLTDKVATSKRQANDNKQELKELKNEKKTTKEDKSSKFNPLGSEIIKALTSVDPKNKTYYGNTTQRGACDFLLNEYGLDNVLKRIEILPKTNKLQFFPTITTPCQLKDKWVQLEDAVERYRSQLKDKTKVAFT